MLTYAYTRKDELEKLLTAFNATPDAMYFSPWSYVDFDRKIEDNTWAKLQIIAVHAGAIKGYLSASICRQTLSISQLAAVKFCEGHDAEFAADLSRVFGFLQQHFRHIRWTACDGSPSQPHYERIALHHGGRVVGRTTKEYKLRDGRLVDVIYYEAPGTDYTEPDGVTMLPDDWSR